MTTLLAIDASTTAVGWAVFEDGEYERSGVFEPNGHDAWDRITDYDMWLDWGIRTLPETNVIAYELATGNRGNMRTNRLMGGLEYATRRNLRDGEIELVTVTASQVRATGCHKLSPVVAAGIAGKEITSGDEADAIGVALAALAKMKREALAAVGAG